MSWSWAVAKMPWKLILGHAPTIVDAARQLLASSMRSRVTAEPGERTRGGIEILQRAVERLEAREVEHAALLADLAKQAREMATAIEVLRARVRLAVIGVAVAVAVALLAVLLAWR